MSLTIVVYVFYVVMALAVIIWLGIVLRREGRIFLDDVFRGNARVATIVSNSLVTGFLVFTLGYALLLLRIDPGAPPALALRTSVHQFGVLLLSLGALHSINMLVLLNTRRRWAQRRGSALGEASDDPESWRRTRLPEHR